MDLIYRKEIQQVVNSIDEMRDLEPTEKIKLIRNAIANIPSSMYGQWTGKEIKQLYEGDDIPNGIYVYYWDSYWGIDEQVQVVRVIKEAFGEKARIIAIPKESELELMSKEELKGLKRVINEQIDKLLEENTELS